ncbi:putative Steroid 5-alpha reductase, C-terminal domain [Calothrix sp. NIES-4071]|nr:putative Steroid 5-alpha reductase, C-terminal domain [Calothrix sp. NIES-4071]BAZ57888.1 putative Steroid 5-alpha reductase, C-terminal domain [Calothrix sp. NIES-4105]
MNHLLLPVTTVNVMFAGIIVIGFIVFLFLGSLLLSGKTVPGCIQSDGTHKLYKLNGLLLFCGANTQKNRFEKNANAIIWGKPAQTLGGKLLISGWWGIGRKLNYTGEIIVYFAFSLTTGTQSIVSYLLPLWLCLLLPNRAWRDEQRCQAKYANFWHDYCTKVRFRMIPFVY